jgi:hypothetical protein
MTVHAFPVSSSGQPAANVRPVQLAPQFFPQDAEVLIYRPARSAMTSGKARTRAWRLRFERRTSSFIEPLMGWTGGDDTLVQVELSCPSAEAAIAYARRQGLRYNVQGLSQRKAGHPDRRERDRGRRRRCGGTPAADGMGRANAWTRCDPGRIWARTRSDLALCRAAGKSRAIPVWGTRRSAICCAAGRSTPICSTSHFPVARPAPTYRDCRRSLTL